MDDSGKEISREEIAQYDRQIRLWGLDAQKRLRKANVLVVGIGGLGSEVVKNIVLAGIDSITLQDDKMTTEEDQNSQLLITPNDIGSNIAEASKNRTVELNPNVTVVVETDPLNCDSLDEEYVKKFDVICCTRTDDDTRTKLNEVCRKNKVAFFCGDVFGFYGYCFIDLNTHEYVEDVVVTKKPDPGNKEEPATKKAKTVEKETVSVKKTISFCSYSDSFKEDWSKRSKRSLRQSSQVFFIMQIVEKFQQKFNRLPQICTEDSATLNKIKTDVLSAANMKPDFVKEDFADYCCSVFTPVSAIVGGVLAQEIIKAISKKDCPHLNYFFFDGTCHSGIVDDISPK